MIKLFRSDTGTNPIILYGSFHNPGDAKAAAERNYQDNRAPNIKDPFLKPRIQWKLYAPQSPDERWEGTEPSTGVIWVVPCPMAMYSLPKSDLDTVAVVCSN